MGAAPLARRRRSRPAAPACTRRSGAPPRSPPEHRPARTHTRTGSGLRAHKLAPVQTNSSNSPSVVQTVGCSVPRRRARLPVRYEERRDETCPVSTGGGTRRVHLVREGRGAGSEIPWDQDSSYPCLPAVGAFRAPFAPAVTPVEARGRGGARAPASRPRSGASSARREATRSSRVRPGHTQHVERGTPRTPAA